MPDRTPMRRSTRFALALVCFLYGTAVFAPLLASDLPLTMLAADERGYQRALRTLPMVVDEYLAARADDSVAKVDAGAIRHRLDVLRRGLPAQPAAKLELFASDFERRASRNSDRNGISALSESARELKQSLQLDSESQAGVRLGATRSFPLLAALSPVDLFAMGLFLAALTAPFWRRRLGLARGIGLGLLLALGLAGLSWQLGSGAVSAGLKAEMASGGVRVESALFAPIAFGYAETHLEESFLAPSWVRDRTDNAAEVRPGEPESSSPARHWLGTDALGRDMLARLLHGGRLSLTVALLASLLVGLIGVTAGTLAGMLGGVFDLCFLRLVEVVQSFPAFLLILAGVAFIPPHSLHPSITIAVVIGIVGWTEIGRLVRAELLRLRELDLTTAAHALGIRPLRIAFRHLLPLALPPVLVAAAFATSGAVLTESAISFLGFGIGPPVPSWGGLIAVDRDPNVWWMQLFPGAFVFLTVVAFNLLGEGLRLTLDPRGAANRRPSNRSGART